MNGRLFVSLLLGVVAIFGATFWYFQTRAYYHAVTLSEPDLPQTNAAAPGVTPQAEPAPQIPAATSASLAIPVPLPLEQQHIAALPDVDSAPAPENPSHRTGRVRIQMVRYSDGLPSDILLKNFRGIDADTSPLKFKGCFTAVNSIPFLTETYEVYEGAEPLRAPRWFDCFDVQSITEDLETGDAIAFLGQKNIAFGVDRVISVNSDGDAFVWHQFNACGTAAYGDETLPKNCPPKPER